MNPHFTPDDNASNPRAPLSLELLRGGPNATAGGATNGGAGVAEPNKREAEIARALEKATGSELSPEAIEALASEAPLVPPREPLGARLANYFGRHQLLLFVMSFFALWAIVVAPMPGADTDLGLGLVAPRDIVAPHSAFLPDRAETDKRRDAAAALVTPAYDPNPGALGQALTELPELTRGLRITLQTISAPAPGAVSPGAVSPDATSSGVVSSQVSAADKGVAPTEKFRRLSGWKVTPATLAALLLVEGGRWKTVEDAATGAVRAAYLRGRIRSDVASDSESVRPVLRSQIETFALQTPLSPAEKIAAATLAQRIATVPNVVVNQQKTDAARRDARAAVLPVFSHIEANAPLVRQGERVSAAQWAQMQELGVVTPQFAPLTALAVGALCLMLVSGAAAYIGSARREVLARPAALWLMAVVPVIFLFAFRLILRVPHADFLMISLAATAAMLLTILLDMRLGVPAGFVVAALCALMARVEAELFLAATLSAWIGALLVARFSSRFALLRAIVVLGLINGVLAGALGILHDSPPEEILSSIAWDLLAGGASVLAAAGLAIFLERPFGITSHLRLLELLSPDETVVRRMQVEAPGTYTHSLMVATLAEAAAKKVGADSLLCRVAGLYHDIGKLRRPHCFIENQCGDNIHDRLSPGLSALLIKAHVKDGLELGRAIRLPLPVLEIISSHHGKSTVAYFLHRAKQQAGENGVDEKIYRYPGPKPRSREAAILLLADSVEASTRSIPHLTPDGLDAHIEKIVDSRIREGELSESDLSLREIGAIREAFSVTMRGAMHGRIAYPDAQKVETNRDWVAHTLGERRLHNGPANGVAGGIANGAQVATNARSSQNKEGAPHGAPSKRARRRALKNASCGTSQSPTSNTFNSNGD